MGPDVPPDVGVVADRAGRLHPADGVAVVVVRVELRRQARARKRREHRGARAREARQAAAPERRVGREREQHGQLDQHALHDLHAGVGIGHRDVHVHAEHQLAPRHVLQLLEQVAVPVARRDALVLGQRERVRRRAADAQAERVERVRQAAPDGGQVAAGVVDVAADAGRHLGGRLEQLGRHARRPRLVGQGRQHVVDAAAELERLRIEEHVLLLDAHRQRCAGAVLVVEHAQARAALVGAAHGCERSRPCGQQATAAL